MDDVERVARAISLEDTGFEKYHAEYRNQAIGAIKAMRDCTQGVIEAGVSALSGNGVDEANLDDAKLCYTAMIDAALGEHK